MPQRLVTIAGVGAIGSHLVQLIRNVDADLRVIDFDRVDQGNVASQFHGKPSVGKNKAVALVQTMDFMFKRQRIEAIPNRLTQDNVKALLASTRKGLSEPVYDHLVVDALDNGSSRRILQDHVRAHDIPCLHGGLAAGGLYARVMWDRDFVIDDEPATGAATVPCEGGNFLPMIAITAAFMAQSICTFIETGKCIGYSISPTGVTRV